MGIIDAKDLILGRMCSEVAERLLLGEEMHIVNCEEAAISGDRYRILNDFKRKAHMGTPTKGIFLHRQPYMLVKRTIRGMLPYKRGKGRLAFSKLRCYNKVPEELQSKPMETMEKVNINKLPNTRYLKMKEISHLIGAHFD